MLTMIVVSAGMKLLSLLMLMILPVFFMSAVGRYINSYLKTTGGVVCNQAVLAASVTLEFPLPRTWSLIGDIRVTVQGDSSGTNIVEKKELMDMIQDFRIITTKGTEVHFSAGIDLAKWSGWCMWGNNKIAASRVGFAAAQESAITYVYPLGLGIQKWYNGDGDFFGLPGHMADRLVIQFDDDIVLESKMLTVEVDGIKDGPMPVAYQCVDVYGWDPTAAGELTDIRLPMDSLLRGVYGWTTVHFDVDGTQTDLSTREVAIVKSNRVVLQTQPLSRQYGVQTLQVNDPVSSEGGFNSLESDEHWFWDLDFGEGGHGYEIDMDMNIRVTAGTAHSAVRIHRVCYSLVNAPTT